MHCLHRIVFRLRSLLGRKASEAAMAEEIRLHLELQTEANIAAGMSPEEARYAALREFGGVAQAQECWPDELGVRWIEECLRDLPLAVRLTAGAPGFTAAIVLSLDAGFGTIARQSLTESLLLAALGRTGGVAFARFLDSQLYAVESTDPAVYWLAVAVGGCVALMASWLPARGAARVDSVEALRAERDDCGFRNSDCGTVSAWRRGGRG